MNVLLVFTILGYLSSCVKSFIIPEELPSLLSLIYSNIPPVKKGTDSRVGVGFRLGPHADFQVLLELGPQNNTDPIGGVTTETPAKRETIVMKNPQKLADYFQNFKNYVKLPDFSFLKSEDSVSDSAGGKWIDWWKKNLLSHNQIGKIQFNKVPGIDDMAAEGSEQMTFEVRDPTRDQSYMVNHLRQLYKNKRNDT